MECRAQGTQGAQVQELSPIFDVNQDVCANRCAGMTLSRSWHFPSVRRPAARLHYYPRTEEGPPGAASNEEVP